MKRRTRWIPRLLVSCLVASCGGDDDDGGGADAGPDSGPDLGITAPAPRAVTLVTGDRVIVYSDDRYAIEPASGSDGAFSTHRFNGHLVVMPVDVAPLVTRGQLDRRLFDVTGLLELGYDDAHRPDVPLIVSYGASRTAASALAIAGAPITRSLASVNGGAMRVPKTIAAKWWTSVTAQPKGRAGAAVDLGQGAKIWLDGKRRVVLDRSVPQIGAPAAWENGYTGQGVTVAVLDSGIDAGHPDFAGRIAAMRSFVDGEPDAVDRLGHGTHVASIAAGSGAGQGGRYRGVAPDATLLVGKVCDETGSCPDSAVLAGMEWAAASGAAIVNLSLGGTDTVEIDPLEQAINALTAEHGTLFVAAAGNLGGCGGRDGLEVGSPSTADAALSVGAVDADEQLAFFSCRGPRIGDSALKPEITAPGVLIAAARAAGTEIGDPVDDLYTRASGTSMATPHVSGAAALLAQQHPDWRSAELKAALMESASPNAAIDIFEQGGGRVDVRRAVALNVMASPASLNLGVLAWPHDDDAPIVRTVTYENLGANPVTVDLAFDVRGPGGTPAPSGMFTVEPSSIALPAGGRLDVIVTADGRVPGRDVLFAGALVATAAGQSVRTLVSLDKETQKHDLVLRYRYRDESEGIPNVALASVLDLDTGEIVEPPAERDSNTLRLPRGRYHVDALLLARRTEARRGYVARLVQPLLELDEDTTITVDAAQAVPNAILVPSASARRNREDVTYTRKYVVAGVAQQFTWGLSVFQSLDDPNVARLQTAHMGSVVADADLFVTAGSEWAEPPPPDQPEFHNSPETFDVDLVAARGRFPTGIAWQGRVEDFATVHSEYAAQAPDFVGLASFIQEPPEGAPHDTVSGSPEFTLPFRRTEHHAVLRDAPWIFRLEEFSPSEGTTPAALQSAAPIRLRAGRHYQARWNQAVVGPSLSLLDPSGESHLTRRGDELEVAVVPFYSDKADHHGHSFEETGEARLYREGTLVAQSDWRSASTTTFQVPPEPSSYRLELDSIRGGGALLSTEVHVRWSFQSRQAAGDESAPLPVFSVRFAPSLDENNRAPAGRPFAVPLSLSRQPGGTGSPLRALTVAASYDDGETWHPALVVRCGDLGVALLSHPAGPGRVSLRASAVDREGNAVDQTILHAYHLRE